MKLKQWDRKEPWRVEDFNQALTQIDADFVQRGVNISWYGGYDPTGITDSSQAFNEAVAETSNDTIIIPQGTYLIEQSLVIPKYKKIILSRSSLIKPAEGVTIQIEGCVEADAGSFVFDLSLGGNIEILSQENHVHIEWFGAKLDGLTDDSFAFNGAVRSLVRGGTISLPGNVKILLNDEIKIDNPVNIFGDGYSTVVEQVNWGYPAFRVISSGVSIDKLSIRAINQAPEVTKPLYSNGEPERDHCAGIYGDECESLIVGKVHVEGFVCGVSLKGSLNLSSNNSIENLTISNVNFGLLYNAQRKLRVSSISGSYKMVYPNLPPHLIYGTVGVRNVSSELITIESAEAFEGESSLAVQLKGTKFVNVQNIRATNCSGVLCLDAVENATFSSVSGTGISDIGLYFLNVNGPNKNITFGQVDVETVAGMNLSAVGIGANSENIFFNGLNITSNMTSDSTSSAVYVRGRGHRFNNVKITHAGSRKHGIVFNEGELHEVDGVSLINVLDGIVVEAPVLNCKIKYAPDMIDALYSSVNSHNDTTKIIRDYAYKKMSPRQVGSNVYDVRPSNATLFEVEVSSQTNPNMQNPLERAIGMQLSFTFVNSWNLSITTTWQDNYVLTGGQLSVLPGKRSMITFVYNGNSWLEFSRTVNV